MLKEISALKEKIKKLEKPESPYKQAGESAEKYLSIFENAIEGIFQTTPDGRYLSANPALAQILGYESPDDLMVAVTDIGRQHYVNPEEREEHIRLIKEKGQVWQEY